MSAIGPGRARFTLAVLTAINFLNYLDRYLVVGVLTRVEESLHITHSQGGLLGSVFIVVYMIFAPIGGVLGDRYPRRFVLAGSIFLWSLATIGSGLAQSFFVLLAARAIVGIGEAGYATVAPGLISDLFPRAERTKMLAIFYVAIPVGSAAGFALGGWIGSAFSWHTAFFVGGLPGILVSLLALRIPEPTRGATDEGPTQKAIPFLKGLRQLSHNAMFWTAVAGITLMTFSIGGLAFFMPAFLELERGISATRAGFLFGAITAAAGTVGTLVGGVLGARADRASRTGGLWLSGVGLLLAAPFMVLVARAGAPVWIFAAVGVAQFLIFLNAGPLNAAIVNAVPPHFRSFAVGVSVLCYHLLGDAISPYIVGKVGEWINLGAAIQLNALPVLAGGLVLCIGARVLRRREPALVT